MLSNHFLEFQVFTRKSSVGMIVHHTMQYNLIKGHHFRGEIQKLVAHILFSLPYKQSPLKKERKKGEKTIQEKLTVIICQLGNYSSILYPLCIFSSLYVAYTLQINLHSLHGQNFDFLVYLILLYMFA